MKRGDIRHPLELSHWIDGFHTPAALRAFLDRDTDSACAWLAANQSWHHRLRPLAPTGGGVVGG